MKNKMKKLLFGCFVIATFFMQTSCLGDGENNSSGYVLGVVEFDYTTLSNMIYFSDSDYPMYIGSDYSSSIQSGECCYLEYTLYGENNPDVYNTGYYVVAPSGYSVIPQYSLSSTLTDTTTVLEDELVTNTVLAYNYVKGYLFLSSTHDNVGDGQENDFDLSYNYNMEPDVENGNNVYNLYLRVRKTKDGTSPTTTTELLKTYYIKYFIDNITALEKNKGNSSIYFRIKYVTKFGDESISTWSTSDNIGIAISES